MGIDWCFYVEDKKGKWVCLDCWLVGKKFEDMGWKVKWKWTETFMIDVIYEWIGLEKEEVEGYIIFPLNFEGEKEAISIMLKNGNEIMFDMDDKKLPKVVLYLPYVRAKRVAHFYESYMQDEMVFDFGRVEERLKYLDHPFGFVWRDRTIRRLIDVAKERTAKAKTEIAKRKGVELVRKLSWFLKLEERKFIDISW